MELDQYIVNAFAGRAFEGNPAAVVPLQKWLADDLMQAIAEQNNLAETAFYVLEDDGQDRIRWFTPTVEVDLCGHATLASAFIVNALEGREAIEFESRSGPLSAELQGNWWILDFPSEVAEPVSAPPELLKALNLAQAECYFNQDYLVVLKDAQALANLDVDFDKLLSLQGRGVIVTAASDQYDFVHRFFAPKVGVKEDPVTGSALTKLIPYWADRLAKNELYAKQASPRGGEIKCQYHQQRVAIGGQAKLFSKGKIYV